MRYVLLMFLLFKGGSSHAQIETNDVIFLEEVIINNKSGEHKRFVYKTKGKNKATLSINDNNVFLTRINNEKKIKLKGLTLFFSKVDYTNNITFELIILKQDEQNQPSTSLVDKNIKFEIKPSNDKKIQLDLSELDISIKNPFFIGLKKISSPGHLDFSINLNRKKGESIFIRNKLGEWLKIPDSNIKLEIEYIKE